MSAIPPDPRLVSGAPTGPDRDRAGTSTSST